ncbi:hypothetical protein HQ545_05425 [Candidatus Woesearchaeota archaeon]|nr:hypothetical protein [Candidatus Woesearchaeota archaeon]
MELKMFSSKKGIFMTLISVALLGIIIFTYTTTYSYSLQERSAIVEARVSSMNGFLREVESDMGNAVYIAGFRSFIGMEDYVVSTGSFFDSTDDAFVNLFLNGTLFGQPVSVMQNNTFPDWVIKINSNAIEAGYNISINVSNVTLSHIDPWNVRIFVEYLMNLSDIKNTAEWSVNGSVYADISVIGFEDPWYAVYTSNNIFKRINRTVYDGDFTSIGSNTTNIRNHVSNTLYTNFTGASSFLMKFENSFNASPYGIESFVDKSEVSIYHACPTETSSVDSIYWNCDNSITVFKAANWTGFRIDNETAPDSSIGRVERYMMEDYLI